MRLKFFSLAAFVVSGSMLLAACGGGNDSPLRPISQATTDLTVAVTPVTVQAVLEKIFIFPSGVKELGTTSTTTLTFFGAGTAKSSFVIKSGDYEAKGEMGDGSCTFTVISSSFLPAVDFPSLQVNESTKIIPCDLKLKTAGLLADGKPSDTMMTFLLGSAVSGLVPVTVTISPTGVVTVNGVTLGTVSVVVTTGAGG